MISFTAGLSEQSKLFMRQGDKISNYVLAVEGLPGWQISTESTETREPITINSQIASHNPAPGQPP